MADVYIREVEVVNLLGIHARPSSQIAKLVNDLQIKNVFIEKVSEPGNKMNPASLLHMMMMGAVVGTKLIVFTNDENMHQGVDALVKLIESGFGEECVKK